MATIDVMISEEEIAKKVEELAKQIEKDYEGEQLLVVGILKGASVFVSDLIRKINLDVNIDFMSVSSYGNGTESSGTVRILKDLDVDIAGKNVLYKNIGALNSMAVVEEEITDNIREALVKEELAFENLTAEEYYVFKTTKTDSENMEELWKN